MADIKLDISPMYEGERIRKDDLWVELGGPKADGFELSLATPMDQIEDGKVTVVGPDLGEIKEGSIIPFGMVFKVGGETNTGDFSPDPDANTRPDIPLHALSILKFPRAGLTPDEPGKRGPLKQFEAMKAKGHPLVYVGDVVGTGSSRKSAANSLLWWTGQDIPNVPNKKFGGFVFAGKIAPIFYNTMQDSGALPIEMDVSKLEMGDVIELRPFEGKVLKNGDARILVYSDGKDWRKVKDDSIYSGA